MSRHTMYMSCIVIIYDVYVGDRPQVRGSLFIRSHAIQCSYYVRGIVPWPMAL